MSFSYTLRSANGLSFTRPYGKLLKQPGALLALF